jgi:hypothetical protein
VVIVGGNCSRKKNTRNNNFYSNTSGNNMPNINHTYRIYRILAFMVIRQREQGNLFHPQPNDGTFHDMSRTCEMRSEIVNAVSCHLGIKYNESPQL